MVGFEQVGSELSIFASEQKYCNERPTSIWEILVADHDGQERRLPADEAGYSKGIAEGGNPCLAGRQATPGAFCFFKSVLVKKMLMFDFCSVI